MTFLKEPAAGPGQQKMYDEDIEDDGYVWDVTTLWAHQPELDASFKALWGAAADAAGLSLRDKAMLVIGQARTIGDSYCSVAWSRWLTEQVDTETALAAVSGDEGPFTERERALTAWASTIARDANGTSQEAVQALRDVGFDDPQILALTMYAALRLAVSTVNDALGARPDAALVGMLDPRIQAVVTWGRQPV